MTSPLIQIADSLPVLKFDLPIHIYVQSNLLYSLVFFLISNLPNGLSLHQFLGAKTTEASKSLKTDANKAH